MIEQKQDENRKSLFSKSSDFSEIFSKGKQFMEEILKENERLRLRINQLENESAKKESADYDAVIKQLQKTINLLEEKIKSMETKYFSIERENKDFAEKYVEIEDQNNNLANLYVASFQLHSTLDFQEVVKIVMEIVINLIGSENFALCWVDEKKREIVRIASEGEIPSDEQVIGFGSGIIGTAAEQGDSYYIADISLRQSDEPLAVIPLKIKESVIGIIVIYQLLSHKKGFTSIDHELFSLLAGHAATALYSARLYTESEKRVSTLKGFIDMLKYQKI